MIHKPPLNLSGDLYINFTVGGLLEFPAYILTTLLLMFIGRRLPQAATYLIGGFALLITLGVTSGSMIMEHFNMQGVTYRRESGTETSKCWHA